MKLARVLIKAGAKLKNSEISEKLGEYVVKGANYFVSFPITPNNYRVLEPFMVLSKCLPLREPEVKAQNSNHIVLYLQQHPSETWSS
jgi:hypothetical protein